MKNAERGSVEGSLARALLFLLACAAPGIACKFAPPGFIGPQDIGPRGAPSTDAEIGDERFQDVGPPVRDARETEGPIDGGDLDDRAADAGVLDAVASDAEAVEGPDLDGSSASEAGSDRDAERPADAEIFLDAGSPPDIGFVPFTLYTPSNFDPAAFIPPGPALVITASDCVLTANAAPSFSPSCGALLPRPVVASAPSGPDVVIVSTAALAVIVGGAIRIQGDHPVIFAVYGPASISGAIVADAEHQTPGPGARDWSAQCSVGAGGPTSGAGGGGGGGYGHNGGPGGNGGGGSSSRGGAQGGNFGDDWLVPLAGGCAGGDSGVGTIAQVPGGGGGGAIQISASADFIVDSIGAISAAGGGGRGGLVRGGGGGGGSGGSILLEGGHMTIAPRAAIVANGGGAGGGGATNTGLGGSGGDGADGHALDASPASGGPGSSRGGDGSSGGAGTQNAQMGGAGSMMGGGGGGGGGVGRYRIRSATGCTITGAVLSGQGRRDC